MRNLLLALIGVFSIIYVGTAQTPQLYINEFIASNGSGLTDASGEFTDWVEIYNAGSAAVDIGGMYVTDDLLEPTLWQIPSTNSAATTIQSGGFLVLFFDGDIAEGVLHVDAKLGASGEAIGLFASDGTAIDSYTFGPQLQDISEGRTPDGGNAWAFFSEPTPGAANNTTTGNENAAIPVANIEGGFYDNSVTISLSSETEGASIYYRMDGKIPDNSDQLYTGPITLTSTGVVRAISYGPGQDESEVMTHTYIIDEDRENFVVVAMTTDPDNLFDPENGLFPNYEIELEKNAHIQFFETDGSIAFSQEIEIELSGNATLVLPQKSLKMKAKASLGNEYFDHKIFPDEAPEKYRSFLMRQSGQDWNKTMFRDALQQNLMTDVSDLNGIIKNPDLDLQSFRPGILYINGEYWGIQNIRAQMSWKYVDAHYGLDKEELDVIENENELKTGDLVELEDFNNYLESTNFNSSVNYLELRERADVDHFIDYMLHGIICDNNDWPANNNRKWRERVEDGKWRWLSKDMDFGFGLRPINAPWESGDFTTNTLAICLAENSSEYYNEPYSTLFLRRLMQNDEAKSNFINRAADLLNSVFEEDRIVNRINDLEGIYIPQMQDHFDKWQSGWNGHADQVEKLRFFAEGRAAEVRGHFVNEFSEVSGLSDVQINANPGIGGTIDFNTLTLNEAHFPWDGIYFRGLEIPAVAKANRGYLFGSWSGAASGTNPEVLIDINSSSEILTANFQLGSTDNVPIIINEINYNSPDDINPGDWVELYNPNNYPVNISAWYFEDESGNFFGFPANTLIGAGAYFLLVEDEASFAGVYPDVTNVYGSFGDGDNGFGLSGKGELITLKNAAGIIIDEVEYDDKNPWPEEPDGDGPTLQLISPALDNALPESWLGFEGTPGKVNSGGVFLDCSDPIDFALAPGETEMIVNWPSPQASTICIVSSIVTLNQVSGPTNGSVLQEGIYTIEYVAVDECGNSVNCAFDITVSGAELEATLNCPNNIVVNAAVGATGAIVSWPALTGSTNCSLGTGLTITQSTGLPSGSMLPIGTTTITYKATDDCGTLLNCSFDITVISLQSTITLNCNDDVNIVSESGTGEIVSWNAPSAQTNCSENSFVTLTQTAGLTSGSFFPIGTQTIVYEATDVCGTIITCNFDVTVSSEAGSITLNCPENLNVVLPQGQISTPVTWPMPTASTECIEGNSNPNCGTNIPGFAFFGSLDNHQYYISLERMQWATAQANCEDYGGHLAVINDPVENAFLKANITQQVYIGMSDTNSEGNPEWVNDEPFTFSLTDPTSGSNTEANDYGYLSPWTDEWKFLDESVYKNYLMELDCGGGNGLQLRQTGGPANGSDLPAGTYGITYEASDDCGEVKYCSFIVTVENEPESLTIDCPSDITVTEANGTGGANVVWSGATAENFSCTGTVDVLQIGGLPSGSFFPIGNYVIVYEASDDCDNIEFCSFNVSVLPDVSSGEYCEAEGSLPWLEHITNVTFGNINNDSGKEGYGDFTDQSTEIVAGEAYPISITPKFSYTQYNEYFSVWIDFNLDKDFNDVGELVLTNLRLAGPSGTDAAPIVGLVQVPANVVSGTSRMRVLMHRDDILSPCLIFESGEVEDYSVNLSQSIGGANNAIDRTSESAVVTKSFTVYPNPVKDMLTIDLADLGKSAQLLEIYNVLGQQLLVKDIVEGTIEPIVIDVSNYVSGLYFVTMVDALTGERIVKQVVMD